MKQDPKIITNRRSFLISSAAAAGLVLYPETLLFGHRRASPAGAAIAAQSTVIAPPQASPGLIR